MNKSFFIIIGILLVIATGFVLISKPVMHKQFNVSVIDYLIKFNDDGSMTTTKQTTTTQVQEKRGN